MESFSYAQVEAALARINGIGADRIGVLRGRLQHFRRIGLVAASPGKGKRVDFGITDARVWALAIELAGFGADPLTAKHILDFWRPQILQAFLQAEAEPENLFLALRMDFLTSPPGSEGEEQPMRWLQVWRESEISMRELNRWLGRRWGMFNLSDMVRALDKALGRAR
jgi:hypothetical protein